MSIIAATALSAGDHPSPELAAEAVGLALERSGERIARSVLLFLSGEFARHAQAAVTAASRASRCLQVIGCTATGVFNEEDWILDRPAAAALVLAGDACAVPTGGSGRPALSLALPDRADGAWLASRQLRIGILSSGNTAEAPGRVWCHGKLAEDGRCEAALAGLRGAVAVSRGLRPLGRPQAVTAADGYELLTLEGHPAMAALAQAMAADPQVSGRPLAAAFAALLRDEADDAFAAGRYAVLPILCLGAADGSITLGGKVAPGSRLLWVVRDPAAALDDTRDALERSLGALGGGPDFALLFSCMGRGPYFFGQTDEDIACLKRRLPGTPLLGAYGCGEIAVTGDRCEILHNSAVLGLFRGDV